jgi:hypothetical protein
MLAAKYIREPMMKTYDDDHYIIKSFETILKEYEEYLEDRF